MKRTPQKSIDLSARMPSELIIKELSELEAARAFREGEGWICESDYNEVNGARVMPPSPSTDSPHTTHLSIPPPLLQNPWASGQKILKNGGTSLSRTIRHLSPMVS